MSNFRDLIARMAIDAEFARHTRANPDAVARQYHLSHDESEQLRGLADAAASAGPTALGARLSKMGGITSAVLSGPIFTATDTDGDGISDLLDTDDDNDGIPDATDSKPLVPNLLVAQPTLPTGPIVTLDPDILNPNGDADGDKIPNILDKDDNNVNTTNEAWGDNDKDGIPNRSDEVMNQHLMYNLGLSWAPDSDGDGIKDPVDSNDSDPNTKNEALGDKDGDGIYNYLDKFNIRLPIGDIVLNPELEVLEPGPGSDPTPPPPPPADPTPPPPATPPAAPPTGGEGPSTPDIIVNVDAPPAAGQAAPAQQPILLADDAVGKPVVVQPQSDGGISTGVLLVGGAALAAGAVAGGLAGKLVSDKSSPTKDEE